MAERENLSKKIRFEVFKRDSFTCQYCGRMAPDVVLEVDHINPVKHGGRNEILNLITSCFDCNRGKGGKQLTDNQTIKKQQEQLKELNERREQLKLMLAWKKELNGFIDEQVDEINKLLAENTKREFSDYGKDMCKKLIKEFGFSEVYGSTIIAIDRYYVPTVSQSVAIVVNKIGGVCYNRRKQRDANGS